MRSDISTQDPQPQLKTLQQGYRISTTRIVILSILSLGMYWFYWFYWTWKQYRDHTATPVFPVWHSLTQLIQVYSIFRLHHHARAYQRLMQDQGTPNTLNPKAIVWLAISGVLASATYFLIQNNAGLIFLALEIAILTLLMCWIQENTNRYWDHFEHRHAPAARTSPAEVIFMALTTGFIFLTSIL